MPKPTAAEFFSLFGEDYHCQVPHRVMDCLGADIGLSVQERAVFGTLCRWVPVSLTRDAWVEETREAVVWPRAHKVLELMGPGMSRRTYFRTIDRLEELGVIRSRTKAPGPRMFFIPSMQELARRLGLSSVGMRGIFPENYDDVTIRLMSTTPLDLEERDVEEALETGRDPMAMKKRVDALRAAMDEAAARQKEAAAKQAAKKPSEKMGGGRKAKRKPSKVSARELYDELCVSTRTRLGIAATAAPTVANLAKLRRLRDLHGSDKVLEVIEVITDPEGWEGAKRVCGQDFVSPTPGILLGFQDTLFPWALETRHTESLRSGGAGKDKASNEF